MNTEKISKFITQKRKEQKLTQKELADLTHLSEKTISKWETGRGIPDIGNLQILAEVLDVTVTELLNGEESKKEDNVIEYIKYKDKKNKRYIMYITLSLLTIFILILVCLFIKYQNFYKTNYEKNQITKLSGSGELFDINDMLIIKSPEKTIMVTGKIIPKDNIKVSEENITGYSIDCEEEHIVSKGGPYISLMPSLSEELNGYNELFNEKKLNNLDKWSITIYYKQGEESKKEVIELDNEVILSTDKLEKEEIESIGIENKEINQNSKSVLGSRLEEKGFIETSDRVYELKSDQYSLIIDLISGDLFYSDSNTSIICKDFGHSAANLGTMEFDGIDKYYIEVIDGKLKCNEEGKCNPKKETKAKEVYRIIKEYFE